MSKTSDFIRKTFREGDEKRDAGLETPEYVERYDDLLYGENEKWQRLDVYRPKSEAGKRLPVIVSVHGGGWVYGDKERYQYYCMSLVKYGFAVVNFTYRLAPEYQYPAAVEDTNLVMKWVTEHAEEYLFDAEHVFAVGDSAGAHNLGLYTAIYTNPEYAEQYDFKIPEGLKLRAVAFNCGAYQIDPQNEPDDLTMKLMADYLPDGGTAEELARISVAEHITPDYLPTCFMTCTGDFLQGQAPILQKKFLECSVPHEFLFYGDSSHELGHVFHLDMRSEQAEKCNRTECEFFQKFLQGE